MTFAENINRICAERGTNLTAVIAKRAMEIIEKESADTTYLDGLNAELKDVQKKIKNLVSAIEQGIITSATKDRLDELEQEKSDIEGRIAREEMKKPLLNESRIRYWLTSFKSGNVDDEDYQRRVIDTLVNSVYVYDDEDGGKQTQSAFFFFATGRDEVVKVVVFRFLRKSDPVYSKSIEYISKVIRKN